MTREGPAHEPSALRLTRAIPAPSHQVWRAWTDPADIATWFWPPSFETTAEVDLRIGGRYRIASAVAGIAVSGEFVAVDEGQRLAHTWQWDGEDVVTLVTVEFRDTLEAARHTEVVVLHERFPSADERDNHIQGWQDCLDRLVDHHF